MAVRDMLVGIGWFCMQDRGAGIGMCSWKCRGCHGHIQVSIFFRNHFILVDSGLCGPHLDEVDVNQDTWVMVRCMRTRAPGSQGPADGLQAKSACRGWGLLLWTPRFLGCCIWFRDWGSGFRV